YRLFGLAIRPATLTRLVPVSALVGLTRAVTVVPVPEPEPAQAVGVSVVPDCRHTVEPSSVAYDQVPPLPVSQTLRVGCSKLSENNTAACAGVAASTAA